ncbi:hypothetical protein KSS87_020838 [Heliosperma pusillum]|nr:hypothetical protein KSS87_020838 [Heliosperma pusillum]
MKLKSRVIDVILDFTIHNEEQLSHNRTLISLPLSLDKRN